MDEPEEHEKIFNSRYAIACSLRKSNGQMVIVLTKLPAYL